MEPKSKGGGIAAFTIPTSPTPSLYFNGFALSITPADVHINVMQDGNVVGVLRMSYTTAKTFAKKLSDGMDFLDKKLEHPIYTIDDMNERLKPAGGKDPHGSTG